MAENHVQPPLRNVPASSRDLDPRRATPPTPPDAAAWPPSPLVEEVREGGAHRQADRRTFAAPNPIRNLEPLQAAATRRGTGAPA